MKKMIRTGALVAALFSTTIQYATEVVSTQPLKENVTAVQAQVGDRILVKNANGRVILEASAGQLQDVESVFDLSNLKDGTYYYEIESATQITVVPVALNQGNAQFDYASGKAIYKPMVQTRENLLYVSQLSFDQAPLDIELYYDANNDGTNSYSLVHKDQVTDAQQLAKVFALDQKETGNYKVVLVSDGRRFVQDFRF